MIEYHSFSSDGRYILSRDYMSVKIWDVNMESKPVKTILLHEYLKPVLYDLYTADIIFDKFEVSCSPDGRSFASGSYGYDYEYFLLYTLMVISNIVPSNFCAIETN